MSTREHTDPKALDQLYYLPSPPPRPWYATVWLWIKEDLLKEPLESRDEDNEVMRRIRVHEWATRGARRLRKLDRKDAADILVVTAMLLGFEDTWAPTRRPREARRAGRGV